MTSLNPQLPTNIRNDGVDDQTIRSLKNIGLNASGGPQFTASILQNICAEIKAKTTETKAKNQSVMFLDLREEAHWCGGGGNIESSCFLQAEKEPKAAESDGDTLDRIEYENAFAAQHDLTTEHAAISTLKKTENSPSLLEYKRIPVVDHLHPNRYALEQYLKVMIDANNNGQWIHAHCRKGRGRTSIFLLIMDMVTRPERCETAEDLISLHHKQGSSNLLDVAKCDNKTVSSDGTPFTPEMKAYRSQTAKERVAFLHICFKHRYDLNDCLTTLDVHERNQLIAQTLDSIYTKIDNGKTTQVVRNTDNA